MACNPRYHSTHATHASTPPTLARHPRKHATHANHASTLPTQAHATHATHASTPPTLALHPRKHATHAAHPSTNSTPFLKLFKYIYISYAAFTLIYVLIVHILLVNKVIRNWLYLHIKT